MYSFHDCCRLIHTCMLLVYRASSVSEPSSSSSSSSSFFDAHSFVRTDVASRAQIEIAEIFVKIPDYNSNPEYKSTPTFSNDFRYKKGRIIIGNIR